MLSYNRANRAVAILCNHQRAIPKTHDKSMANLQVGMVVYPTFRCMHISCTLLGVPSFARF